MEFTSGALELLNSISSLKRSFKFEVILRKLSYNEIRILGILYEESTKSDELIQAKGLSDIMKISRPAINSVLNKLEDNKLISRERSHLNRKAVFIRLLEQGKDLYLEEHEGIVKLMNHVVNILGDKDILDLIRIINRLEKIINIEVKDA